MTWATSLIKLSTYEVEVLQKRLAEIADKRVAGEMKLAVLQAEGEAETRRATQSGEAWQLMAYLAALKARKDRAQAELEFLYLEERGARDALAQAFEEQKKYEHIVEQARLTAVREETRRETAALDELGLRKAAGERG